MRERIETNGIPSVVLDAISQPVIMVSAENYIAYANLDAEQFFRSGSSILARNRLESFLPFGSPLLALVDQVRTSQMPVNEYRVDVSSPRLGAERIVDVYVAPVAELPGAVVILFKEKTMAEKIDRQMTHRGAARSVTGLASMLAHEIKTLYPVSAVRHNCWSRLSAMKIERLRASLPTKRIGLFHWLTAWKFSRTSAPSSALRSTFTRFWIM